MQSSCWGNKTRSRLPAKVAATLLAFWLGLVNVPFAGALGPVFRETSFEEFVSESTLIAIGRVQSASAFKEKEGWKFTRRTTVDVLKVVKGDSTVKGVVIYHEAVYPSVEVSLTEGHTYLLFLYRERDFYRFLPPPYWASWEVVDDQLVNRKPWSEKITRIPTTAFLASIDSEMHRTARPVQKKFAGIEVGTTLQRATLSSGLSFIKYKDIYDNDVNWTRYYALPRNRQEHLVTLDLYKGYIVYLNVYFLRNCGDCPNKLLRNLELKYGGLGLGQFGDLSFDLGRMWSDDNVEVRLGSIYFGKANGFPWGEFAAYRISITEKHVLHEYQFGDSKEPKAN
jgi:hypothetical protein